MENMTLVYAANVFFMAVFSVVCLALMAKYASDDMQAVLREIMHIGIDIGDIQEDVERFIEDRGVLFYVHVIDETENDIAIHHDVPLKDLTAIIQDCEERGHIAQVWTEDE